MIEPTNADLIDDSGASDSPQPPTDRFLELSKAHDLYKRRGYIDGEIICRAQIAVDRDDVHALTLLAACLYQRGLITEALTQTERALTVWPEDEDLLTLQEVLLLALTERYAGQRLCA